MNATPLNYGYVTNGLSGHRLADALDLLADNGYTGVALTLDHCHFDPFADDWAANAAELRRELESRQLACVIETGARFILDPRRKHHPTLLHEESGPRVAFIERAIEIAAAVGAPVVSLWSGALPDDIPPDVARTRLRTNLMALLAKAETHGIVLGFEPEPGMFIETITDFELLHADLGAPAGLGITLDIGHCVCLEKQTVAECIARATPHLVHVHIEDMRRGVHEHLMFGEGGGELDLPDALAALVRAGYQGMVAVELSRDSHRAHQLVPAAIDTLRAAGVEGGRQ